MKVRRLRSAHFTRPSESGGPALRAQSQTRGRSSSDLAFSPKATPAAGLASQRLSFRICKVGNSGPRCWAVSGNTQGHWCRPPGRHTGAGHRPDEVGDRVKQQPRKKTEGQGGISGGGREGPGAGSCPWRLPEPLLGGGSRPAALGSAAR